MTRDGVLLVAHGTVDDLDDLPAFLTRIRHGRPPSPDLVAEVRRRYTLIGHSPLLEQTRVQAAKLCERLQLPVFVGMRLWEPSVEGALKQALERIPALREEFWHDVAVLGSGETFNQELEYAGRVADFLEFAELLCHDALHREESCGAHFREEHQTALGEPVRDDTRFSYVAAWEYVPNGRPVLHKEPLLFEFVKPSMRTYY